MNILFVSLGGNSPNAAPPLGMLYLSSIALSKGCSVKFHDASFSLNDRNKFAAYLETMKADDFSPDICGFTLFTINLLASYDFAGIVKERFPQCKVMVGGPHATALPERTMQECGSIDVLAYGEGEKTFSEIIDSMTASGPLEDIDGIYFRKNGSIAHTRPRKYIEDLDGIPFPAFELLPKDYPYKDFDWGNLGDKGAPIITSRGCPYECTFCYKDIFGTKFRRRSPHNVVSEIKRLMENFGINNIFFEDDFFAVNRKWLAEFYEEMNANNVSITWRCQGRVGVLNKSDYIMMKKSGCYHITFGVESGNDDVLKDIKKKITVKQTLDTFNEVRKTGLAVAGNFIFGHRKDTLETMADTLRIAMKANPDSVNFLCLAPIPGSETFSYLPEDLKYSWDKHGAYVGDSSTLPISICGIDAETLNKIKVAAYMRFYLSARYFVWNIAHPRNMRKPFFKIKIHLWLNHFLSHCISTLEKQKILAEPLSVARKYYRKYILNHT